MFVEAIEQARKFTFPIVLSRQTFDRKCASSIGAYTVLNREGWVITCLHIVEQFAELLQGEANAREIEKQIADIESDTTLSKWGKSRKITRLARFRPSDIYRGSIWWGLDGVRMTTCHLVPALDLAIGKLEPFDQKWVSHYPVFKDPSKGYRVGASLCKLGYPFHHITPHYDDKKGAFVLPQGAVPLPLFPIEGILTRFISAKIPGSESPFPLRFFETSTPGLKGQSGGPVFDTRGTVWGIQSSTTHYPLGFDPPVPGGSGNEREHQFLNVGRAMHMESIMGALNKFGVKFTPSDY